MSFAHLGVSRKQFLLGLVVGGISTLPLVYNDMYVVGNLVEEILFSLSIISQSYFGFALILNLGIFFVCVAGMFFILQCILSRSYKNMLPYLYSFLGICALVSLFSLCIYIVSGLVGNGVGNKSISSGSFVFLGLWSIMGYYIIISLLEEGVKYISSLNLGTYNSSSTFAKALSAGAVIALGFAFFENILYSYQYVVLQGIEGELIRIVFFRSFFTLALHVLCGMLLSAAFYMLLILRGKYRFALLLFFAFGALSIISHMFFDVALTYGYIGIIFLYAFLLYLLMGYITSSD